MTADARAPGGRSSARSWRESAADRKITLRLIMPDHWLEYVTDLPRTTTVEDAKRLGLRELLQRDSDRPADFYVEYAERRVPDETVTLADLGAQDGEILSIRAYDLGHYPRFRG